MGTEFNTATTMQTHIDIALLILTDRIHRAGTDAFSASDALLFADDDTTTLTLRKSPGWAGSDTGCRITAQTDKGRKTGGQTSDRMDAYS